MTVPCATPERRPTAAEIFDTPLPVLLANWEIDLFVSSVTDRTFFGAVVQRKTGEIGLAMPPSRPELEHDTMARYLLAQVFDVDLGELPPPFTTTSL